MMVRIKIKEIKTVSKKKNRGETEFVVDVGQKIRNLRRKLGLSIETLARRSDLSTAAIQKIETNHMVPTIISLMKISRALGEKVSFFVDEGDGSDQIVLIKRNERKGFYSEESKMSQEYITGQLEKRVLEGGIFNIKTGGQSGREMNSHPGEEIIFCLKGKIEVFTPAMNYVLSTGDTLHFNSDIPHRWRNLGSTAAQIIWIYTQRST
jgi:transcriptional regulator with XRE-family HTH domain